MKGYQRLVSYLYRYDNGVKGENVGYVRIELRGERCRVTTQLQDTLTVLPEMSFFIQGDEDMTRIPAGRLVRNGSGFGARTETRSGQIMNSEYTFEDMDGIIIQSSQDVFYATTWKDIVIHTKGKNVSGEAGMERGETFQEQSPDTTLEQEGEEGQRQETEAQKQEMEAQRRDTEGQRQEGESFSEEIAAAQDMKVPKATVDLEASQQTESGAVPPLPPCGAKQSCCGCSERERVVDFGRRILSVFPKMYPFEIENMGECVRLDLKDIGSLPVKYWSLAGNPFLLHGYYCYRHLIFTQTGNGEYAVGVPGIYNADNEGRAKECGLTKFQTLSEVRDRQGAFGYWLYPVS